MARHFTKFRHWKQRFDLNAEFIYRRRLLVGEKMKKHTVIKDCCPQQVEERVGVYVEQGDTVDKEFWGKHRLRRLWDSNAIELKDWKDPVLAQRKVGPQEASPLGDSQNTTTPPPDVQFIGCGWYGVTYEGKTYRVQGKEAAEEKAASLLDPSNTEPEVEHLGGGWAVVRHEGNETKVQGKAALEELLEKLKG